MQIFWISATLAASDTFFMFSTTSTNKYRDHFSSICHILYISTLVLDRCTCFSFPFPSEQCFYLMEQSYQSVCKWNSLNLLLWCLVCLLLQFCQYWLACQYCMVMLLSLLCITVSGSCWYHLSVILISWSLQMLQWRHAAALLCLATHSILANTSHPDTIWPTVWMSTFCICSLLAGRK